MAKTKGTPLYLSYVDTINDMLGRMNFEPDLPPHKRSIDRSGRNVDWLRKAFKRGTVALVATTGTWQTIDPEFPKLMQLLEVPFQKPVNGAAHLEQEMDNRISHKEDPNSAEHSAQMRAAPQTVYTERETRKMRQAHKRREFAMNYGQQATPTGRTELTKDQWIQRKMKDDQADTIRRQLGNLPISLPLAGTVTGRSSMPMPHVPGTFSCDSAHTSKLKQQVMQQLDDLPDGVYDLKDGKVVPSESC